MKLQKHNNEGGYELYIYEYFKYFIHQLILCPRIILLTKCKLISLKSERPKVSRARYFM